MNKIERIEKSLKDWKANKHYLKANGFPITEALEIIDGLKSQLALATLNQPSNTKMHVDKEPCGNCDFYKKITLDKFCRDCGMALSQ